MASRLGLEYIIVGVKIHKEDFQQTYEKKITYCQAVKMVAEGTAERIRLKDFECYSPYLALGFVEPKYVKLADILPAGTKCVEVFAMEDSEENVDVVIFLLNAEQAMKIVSILGKGEPLNFQLSATMALCKEATALPIITHQPNLTLLCGGARMYARYDKNTLALGVPKELCGIFFREEADLRPTERYILHILQDKGRRMSSKEISYDSGLPERTVRNSLQLLHKRGLVEKVVDVRDARTTMYRLKK